MARNFQPDLVIQTTPKFEFSGGINTATESEHLADNEARDILNFRFDDDDTLVPRQGALSFVHQIASANITTRITSVLHMVTSNLLVDQIFSTGNKIYRANSATTPTDVTGTASPGNDKFIQWKLYNNIAIGATNGQTIKYTPLGTAAPLGGSPVNAKFIEIWNDRVWIAGTQGEGRENILYGSKLGDPENWTVTGLADGAVEIDIEPADGDLITGLCAFRGRLFVFKRKRIYTIQPIGGAFPTDATALSVELYAQNIGSISGYSIQPVLDDVLFLSEFGVASLIASERVGDFQSALVSRKVVDLKKIFFSVSTDSEISACVVPEHNQYWLLIPKEYSFSGTDEAFILDFRRIQEGVMRWTRYKGAVAGTVMCRMALGQSTGYMIGGRLNSGATTYEIYKYDIVATNIINDQRNVTPTAIEKRLITKSFNVGMPFNRKEWERFGIDFVVNADNSQATVDYIYDDLASKSGQWIFNLPLTGGRTRIKAAKKFKYGANGTRSVAVQFTISNNIVDDSFGIDGIQFFYSILPEKRATYI